MLTINLCAHSAIKLLEPYLDQLHFHHYDMHIKLVFYMDGSSRPCDQFTIPDNWSTRVKSCETSFPD